MEKRCSKIWRKVLTVFITAGIILITSEQTRSVTEINESYENLKIFSEVLSLIQSNYVEEVESQKMIEGAINGMLRTLDPHSSYLNKDNYKEVQIDTEGEFGGLGIEITIKNNVLTVVSPIEDTPAFEAGIKAGDKITKVDGEETKDMNITEAVKKMRGIKGTSVTLTILREGVAEPFDVTLVRDIIKLKSISSKLLDNNIGYIRIKSFVKDTSSDLLESLEKLEKENKIIGLILDVRNNPGGLLNQAVEVADIFLDKGKLVVYTKGRSETQNMNFVTTDKNVHTDYPMVVLVNAGSASASEIIAGALQDLKRAVILGTQTFGKGSVQTIIPLSDNSGLRLTTARYYTPNGRVIQGEGIIPDIIVENHEVLISTSDDGAKNRKVIREKDLEHHLKGIPKSGEDTEDTNTKEEDKDETGRRDKDGAKGGQDADRKSETIEFKDDSQLERALNLIKGWSIFKNSFSSTDNNHIAAN